MTRDQLQRPQSIASVSCVFAVNCCGSIVVHRLREDIHVLADENNAMPLADQTGFSAILATVTSADAFVGHISVMPSLSSTIPVVIFRVKIYVPAKTFGSIPVPITNFAAPRSTVWCVREYSRSCPISLGVPAVDLLFLFSLAGCFKALGRQELILRWHASVLIIVWDGCCGFSCLSSNR